ncbi:hypothetical protein ABPG74_010019 [Tetrahymena malaccensis]
MTNKTTKGQQASQQKDESQKKIDEEIKNIKAGKIDYKKIIEIGRQQGFLNEENRKQIWPALLEINLSQMPNGKIMNEDQQSKFYDQLKKDIDRSIAFLDAFQNEESSKIKKQQQKLFRILEGLMQKQPELQYYQDPLVYPLEKSALIQLKIIHQLVKQDDPQIGKLLDEIEGPMFSISWILTWFAHSFTDLNKIQRIFDFLLCSQPQTISYLSAALILITKQQLQEGLCACDDGFEQGVIFQFYQNDNLNQLEIDFNKWFQKCEQLEKTYKFDKLVLQFELPKDSNLYENQFNQLLKYRQDLNRKGISKFFFYVKRKLSNKSTPLYLVSGLFAYYTIHNKSSLPKLLQFVKDKIPAKNIFSIQSVASVAAVGILTYYTIKNLLFNFKSF